VGFSSFQSHYTEVETNGKFWETHFLKTIGATAYTAARWYDLSMCTGTPRINVYPGGMRDATRLWYKSSGSIGSGPSVVITTTGITYAVSAGLALTDSANGFKVRGFAPGMSIAISGFVAAGNTCTKTIATVSAGTITLTDTTGLEAEAAGPSVTIAKTTNDTKHIAKAVIRTTAATLTNTVAMLCDYLMFYPLFDGDSDAYQDTTTTIALPRYPTGEGVQMFLVTTADLGPTVGVQARITYTNSLGQHDRLSQLVKLTASAIPVHLPHTGVADGVSSGPFVPLQDGDHGVQYVQGLQLTTGTGAGWLCVVLAKPLLHISARSATVPTERCMLMDVPTMPRVMDEAFLSYLLFAGGAVVGGSLVGGSLEFNWGNT